MRWFKRGSTKPFSAMYLMFIGNFSKFLRVSSALAAEKGSASLLYFMVIRIKMPPGVRPILSKNISDLESSSRNETAACLSEEL